MGKGPPAAVRTVVEIAGGVNSPVASESVRTALAGADADRVVDRGDEYLAVADAIGLRGLLDRLDGAVDQGVVHDEFDLHLRQKVDHVLGTAIKLGMALLAAEPL